MKTVKTNNPHEGTILVQLRLRSKTSKPLTPYTAWDAVERVFKNDPAVEVAQAEFRVAKEEERTSIED